MIATRIAIKLISYPLALAVIFAACRNGVDLADAYGNFESDGQLVTAEIPGKLIEFKVNEGQWLKKGEATGLVDTQQLYLSRQQVLASIRAIQGKLQDSGPQVSLLQKQISVLEKEKARVEKLVNEEAATLKQLDDITGQLDVLQQQIMTVKEQTLIANRGLLSQIGPLEAQIKMIEDQISRCTIINPVEGRVLLKLAEEGEMVSPARPLYRIADVSSLVLRAYISGAQLADLKLGQEVNVAFDMDEETNEITKGTVIWISEQAEFTPKTIQTKEERVNLVYAFKVEVDNPEGKLKIGMPGEVHFTKKREN